MTRTATPVAADLDRRVTLQAQTVTRDPVMGSEVIAWADLATVWAKVIESSSTPATTDNATEAVALYARPMRVRIRWRAGLDKSRTRLLYEGRVLRITGTAELGRRDRIELAVEDWAHE